MTSNRLVPLGEVLIPASEPHAVHPEKSYPIAGVYGFGRGMIRRSPVSGQEIAAAQLFRIKAGQFIYSRLKSFEGAFAVVSDDVNDYFVSNEFPTFDVRRNLLEPAFLGWYFKQPRVWEKLASDGKGIGARRERLHPRRFLDHIINLPSMEVQRCIVARLDSAARQIRASLRSADLTRTELKAMLASAFGKLITHAPRIRMGEVAPLVRRPVTVEAEASYPEVGVRSFGKGTFHKPSLSGLAVGEKRLFEVHEGDIVFNIVFAWEGAVAIATPLDHGRVGSHRFLTCIPDPKRATPEFLRFYFLTSEGLHQLGVASPGGAGRNRTLGLKALEQIRVPAPSLDTQVWFDSLQRKTSDIFVAQSDVAAELDHLMPALLDQAFG